MTGTAAEVTPVSKIEDNNENTYKLDDFFYQVNEKLLKGKNVNVLSKIDSNKVDRYFFKDVRDL